MLDHHDVARHQVGRCETHDLVVGVVPGFDAEQNAQRAALDHRFAAAGRQLLGCQELLGMVGVIVEDSRAQGDFALALRDQLAHLQRDQRGEILRAFTQDVGRALEDRLAFVKAGVAPVVAEAVVGGLDAGLELFVADFEESLADLLVVGVPALVCHAGLSDQSSKGSGHAGRRSFCSGLLEHGQQRDGCCFG